MQADPLSIGKVLSERKRFVVPVYQRTYAWARRELEPLIEQIKGKAEELLATGGVAFSHYMGALLLIPDGEPSFGKVQVFNVVDGQQRLTTFHLCFAALRQIASDLGHTDLSKTLSDLVVHGEDVPMSEPGVERYKLEPTRFDRAVFRDIIDHPRDELQRRYPQGFYKNGNLRGDAPEPIWAYWRICEEIESFIGADDPATPGEVVKERLVAVSKALFEYFRLIVITLSKQDDAQVIFETLNSGGKPLAAMDLVRNDVFYRASRRGEDQEKLLEDHWSVFEHEFWKVEQTQGRIKKPRIDFYLSHMMATEQGRVMALGELFSEYKAFIKARNLTDTPSELAVITRYTETYKRLVLADGSDALGRLARLLHVFDLSTAYPAVLLIAASAAPEAEKDELYQWLGSYVVRRAVCGLTPKNYNNVFVDLVAALREDGVTAPAFAAYFESKAGNETSRFPTDADFRGCIAERPQYGWMQQHRLAYILTQLEFAARDKFNVNGALQEGLWVEHILPQSWTECWPLPDGRTAPADLFTGVDPAMKLAIDQRVGAIHRLGNLTLLTPAANTSAGNHGFAEKRKRLNDSLLRINVEVAALETWDESAIAHRAARLADLAVQLWPAPRA